MQRVVRIDSTKLAGGGIRVHQTDIGGLRAVVSWPKLCVVGSVTDFMPRDAFGVRTAKRGRIENIEKQSRHLSSIHAIPVIPLFVWMKIGSPDRNVNCGVARVEVRYSPVATTVLGVQPGRADEMKTGGTECGIQGRQVCRPLRLIGVSPCLGFGLHTSSGFEEKGSQIHSARVGSDGTNRAKRTCGFLDLDCPGWVGGGHRGAIDTLKARRANNIGCASESQCFIACARGSVRS